MNVVSLSLYLIDGYKTYSSVILGVLCGLGMILSKNYGPGIYEIFQALALLFAGASLVGLRHAVAKIATSAIEADVRRN
jgi:hypothetical protein